MALCNRYILLVLCFLFMENTAQANSDKYIGSNAFTIDELLSVPHVKDPKISPDGKVVWLEQKFGVWNVYLAEGPDYKNTRLTNYTQDDGAEISLIGFTAQEKHLIFKRGRNGFNPAHLVEPPIEELLSIHLKQGTVSKISSEENFPVDNATLSNDGRHLFTAKGGTVWKYALGSKASAQKLFTARGQVNSLLFSPDGSKLAFISDRSQYKRGKYSFVAIYDLEEKTLTYMAPGVGIDQNIVWSPDSKNIAFIRFGYEPRTWRFSNHREGAPFSVVVADAQTGEGDVIWTSETGYGSRFNGFGASGYSGLGGKNGLLWLADNTLIFPYEKTGWKLLYGIPASGGQPRLLTPGKFEIDGVSLSADRTHVMYWANSELDMHRLDLYEMSLGADWKPSLVGTSASLDMRAHSQYINGNDDFLYYLRSTDAPPCMMVQQAKKKPIQISTGPVPSDPVSAKSSPAEVITFKSKGNMEIPAVLWKPKHIEGKGKHPVLVHAHGGPRNKVYPTWESFFGYPVVIQYFLSRGYYVLSVNYRSGIGYGLNFREPESYGGRGAGDADDFIAAAKYLKDNIPEIDPRRMAIYGHSYGGHIVSNVLARSDLYAVGVDSAGVGDWVVEMEKDFKEILQFNIPERMVLEKLAHQSSAISQIENWGNEPILFLHGDNDNSAAMQQTLELYLALKRRGKIADALIMPGEAHSIRLYRNQKKYLKKIDAFLAKHLK